MQPLEYRETPVIEIHHPTLQAGGVQLLVKREDLNHPVISGNKWWKLKYNLAEALLSGHNQLLTFGGAFSNHIFATAAACHEARIKSIGIIRGEKHTPLNATLSFAEKNGMHLHHIPRSEYRVKSEPDYIEKLKNEFGDFYLVPEGGTNLAGIKGAAEFADQLAPVKFDVLFVPVGTAGTITGLIAGFGGNKKIIGIPVIKSADFLKFEIMQFLDQYSHRQYDNWTLLSGHHHGGYAKTSASLVRFMLEMQNNYNLPLDQVYTAKMLYAVFEEVKDGAFPRGTSILAIHTGGLQGSILR